VLDQGVHVPVVAQVHAVLPGYHGDNPWKKVIFFLICFWSWVKFTKMSKTLESYVLSISLCLEFGIGLRWRRCYEG
jgi:hypothetical protein